MPPLFEANGVFLMTEQEKGDSTPKVEDQSKEELNIDFSGIKKKIGSFFKSENKHEVHHKEEDLSLDFSGFVSFWKKNAKWLIPVLCILIAMSVSVYLRTMPQSMPITDDWAQNTVYNFYQNNIASQINQQYPNLPAANKQALVDKEWQKYLEQNKDQLNNDITQVSQQYKDQFRADDGTLYLLGIDPYWYYQKSKYIVENGYPGSEIKEGKPWDSYRLAPIGVEGQFDFHNWMGSVIHKVMNIFGDYPLMFTFFFIGTIFVALSCIPAFFIGRRITGNNIGGFFTAILIAVASFFVQRTTGESSDTDVYVVFFPLLITWLFLEAFEAKELKNKLLWISGAGLATGVFSFAWSGWWYVFDFILGTIVIYLFYILIKDYKRIKENIRSEVFTTNLYLLGAYFVSSSLFISIFTGIKNIWAGLMGPFGFLSLKAVAVNSLWPNIMTTVAELNVAPISQVIEQLGGKLLFFLALVGIALTLLRKDKNGERDIKLPIFLIIWFIASFYATTKGVRFILQATPVFAIAFGAFLGITWHYASEWIHRELKITKIATQIAVFVILSLLLIQPVKAGYDQAYGSVPSMNDGWYNTLTKIKTEGVNNSIITSWWDFGYWFRAIADRPVTFDGGTQVGWGAHWVGKSLLTSDEDETAGILMMLNCGQNGAFDELDKILNDTPKEITLMHQMLLEDKNGATRILEKEGLTPEQINKIINYLHCDAPVDYYITSDDMVGKAGVWGHFGSWNFDKAAMYQETVNLNRNDAISLLTKNWNQSEIEADQTHYQIQNTPADQFVAPWPSYLSGMSGCTKENTNKLSCSVQTQQGTAIILIDLSNYNATLKTNDNKVIYPVSLVYADKEEVKEKKFDESQIGFSVILIPQDVQASNYAVILSDPLLAYSTFTKLFFFNGHGMKCFSRFDSVNTFTGGKISTWKVDYDCKQNNKVFFLPKEEVEAAHILVGFDKHSEEEAKMMIEEIAKNVTATNFADYAKQYSEDGSAVNGGNLGWFSKGMMVKPFEDAAFGLKVGEISEPIKTEFGWHLIWVKDKKTIS